ncbi:pitrilysin family protein [Anaeromyxobacter sp. Fw109-5]|uniref:M16 family metallopeptidase n=1 Tax=Anaeromyxobacter sp. (strain Fw109-5) TaxID=404589 RepID=UPI0000ED7AE1|nr:pitrilysin family protein [Anaeromyxobacter sp. Fw109-5]
MIRRHALAVLVAAALACAGPRAKAPQAPPAAPAAAAVVPAGPDRAKLPERGPAPELELPAQRHFALANGLKVRLVEYRRLPVVAVNLVVEAGAGRDPAKLPGLASFTAAMLTEGTKTRSAIQLSDETNFLGASLRASAGPDAAAVTGGTLAKHLPKFLELFADVTMNPAFPKADFARVQDQRLVMLLQQRDQPQPIASKAFVPVFWGKMPYGHYLLGDEAAVKATRPRDLAAFHARHYRPENAELIVVGDVAEAELRPLLEATLGKWRRGSAPGPLAPRPPAAPHRALLIEKPAAPQSYVLVGMPGVERSSPDYVAASVAFQVLGGGSSSRLFRNLREEKGYTYGVYAMGEARKLAGASLVAGSVKADVTGAALKEIVRELARLREEPVPAQELSDAKDALVLGLPADFATAGGIAGRVAELALHGLPDDYWNGYADAVREVDAEAVQRAARRYLDPAKMTVVMVADPAVVRPQLADVPLGPIEERPAPARAPAPSPGRAVGQR